MQPIAAIIIGYLFGSMLSLVISGRNLLESQQLLKQSKHLHEVGIALMNEALKTEKHWQEVTRNKLSATTLEDQTYFRVAKANELGHFEYYL